MIDRTMNDRKRVSRAPSTRASHPIRHVSFVPLQSWCKAATRCGFAIYPVLKEVGVSIAEDSRDGVTLTLEQSQRLVEACTARSCHGHFPFVLGEHLVIDAVPEVANFFATSPTLRDAIRVFDWIRQLMSPTMGVNLFEKGETAQLRIRMDRLATRLPATVYFTEAVITWMLRDTSSLLGGQFAKRILFRHPAPHYRNLYEDVFGVEVRFEQAHDAIELPRRFLDRALHGAVPELHRQAESRLKQKVAQLPSRTSVAGQVERLISHAPALLSRGISAVADSLGVPVRILQRRLQAENQSYREVLARSRYRMAQSMLLETSLNIEVIGEKLGFADRRAFTRAFVKWAGYSPSTYRRGPNYLLESRN